MKERDNQRSKLYKAENMFRKTYKGKPLPSVKDVEKYCASLLKSKWFKRKFPRLQVISVHDGRGHRRAVCYTDGYTLDGQPTVITIAIPLWARNESVVLHEICHGLIQKHKAWHGWEFAKIMTMLIQNRMGKEEAKYLKDCYKEFRVKYKAPRKISA